MDARANESQKLLNWGFQAFDTVRLFDAGKPIVTPPVWKGTAREAKLGAAGAVFVSVPKGEGAKLQTKVERTDPLVAPLAKGQRVGTLKVTHRGGRAGGRGAAGGAGGGRAGAASSAAPGTRSGCGSSEPQSPLHESPAEPPIAMTNLPDTPVLPERRVRAAAPRPRSGCSTAASSSATASTRWCRSTAASCSASTSTWRGSAAASPSCASPTRTAATNGSSAAAG